MHRIDTILNYYDMLAIYAMTIVSLETNKSAVFIILRNKLK